MNTRLSKSRFQKGLQCNKALWLAVHHPELADTVTEATQWIFDQGTEVGVLARELFPGGIEVAEGHRQTTEALATTTRLLTEGATTLYEPAFFHDDVLVRVDILVSTGEGNWDLYEAKSSTRLKPENVTDAAVQMYVLEGAGLPIHSAHIVHLDSSYVWGGGDYDLGCLFAVEDVTNAARSYLPGILATLESFQTMLRGPEPHVRIGNQCRKPYGCDFAGHCHAMFDCDYPVTAIPRLNERALHALLDLGVTDIREIPDDFRLLSASQRAVVDVVRLGIPYVNAEELARDLSHLDWPVHHLDFETVNPGLPLWPGTHPYETIPFQYSIHVHHEDGTHEHRSFLNAGTADPRRALAESLIADLGGAGSVTHYTSFERTRLHELARALPDLAHDIEAITGRMVDLESIVRTRTNHPAAAGRTTIKAVLPAWCPDLSYEGLPVADGSTASALYLRALRGELSSAESAALRVNLTEYCALDTFAMVRLLEVLREQAQSAAERASAAESTRDPA